MDGNGLLNLTGLTMQADSIYYYYYTHLHTKWVERIVYYSSINPKKWESNASVAKLLKSKVDGNGLKIKCIYNAEMEIILWPFNTFKTIYILEKIIHYSLSIENGDRIPITITNEQNQKWTEIRFLDLIDYRCTLIRSW